MKWTSISLGLTAHSGGQGEGGEQGAAFADLALRADFTAVHFDKLLAEQEAEPCAWFVVRAAALARRESGPGGHNQPDLSHSIRSFFVATEFPSVTLRMYIPGSSDFPSIGR